MREIVLDTETTGLEPSAGHRIVEIGCVELHNSFPTGRSWHRYMNPERDVPQEAYNVHGLSREFLAGHTVFAELADEFLEFVADGRLVIHNARFDMAFINAELERVGRPPIEFDRVVDTLFIARQRHPGAGNSLDDLCRRYGIDNGRRTVHGALLDAEILAEVYIELTGGRQAALSLVEDAPVMLTEAARPAERPQPLPPRLNDADIAAHRAFVATLGQSSLWTRYDPQIPEES